MNTEKIKNYYHSNEEAVDTVIFVVAWILSGVAWFFGWGRWYR
jgi:hypothetical protein